MREYIALVQDKKTKEKKFIYQVTSIMTLADFKEWLPKDKDCKIIKASWNRFGLSMYYCNSCEKEMNASDKDTHLCQKESQE